MRSLLAILLWLPTIASSATYYVRTNGNDTTGDGSNGNPWQTVTKALSTVSVAGGHTINVGDGTYAMNSGSGYLVLNRSFVNPVAIQGEDGEVADVVLTSASGPYNIYQNGPFGNYTFRNLTIRARATTQCVTLNQGAAFSGLRFEHVVFDGDGTSSTSQCIGMASATPSIAIAQNLTLVRCVFKATGGTGGWGIRGSIHSSSPPGTRYTINAYNCRSDDGSLNVGIEAGPGCALWVYGGRYFGGTGKGVLFAQDTHDPGITTIGGIFGAHVKSVTGHAFLIGGGSIGVKAWGCLIENGDHATVIKDARVSNFQHCISRAGTINALLLKGSQTGTFRYNMLRGSITNGTPVLANYDGDVTYTSAGNSLTDNLLTMVGALGKGIRWDSAGDAGGNFLDRNAWRDRRTDRSVMWGSVLASTNVFNLADIRAAFAAGGYPKNERSSGTSIPLVTYRHTETGQVLYALLYDSKGDVYSPDGFVLPRFDETGYLSQSVLPMDEEVAGSRIYHFVWPRHVSAGTYTVRVFSVSEFGFPSMTDTILKEIRIEWPDVAAKVNQLRNTSIPPG